MRIVGGRLRGRVIAGPSARDTGAIRPTSDRLRESLFNVLAHAYGDPVADARVIDLFAGTGALALEALSRGARFAMFVDSGSEARALIRGNVEVLGLGGITRLFRSDATRLGAAPPGEVFTLAFLDPPYGHGFAGPALAQLHAGHWLAADALCVIEDAAGASFSPPDGFETIEVREHGDSRLIFARYRE